MSWKPEVEVVNEEGKWHGNGLRFATREEALSNATALMGRWMMVLQCRATKSDDPVNYAWVNGELVPVKAEGASA